MEYNFTTRQLYPYSDKWDNGMKGALWYIWEEDALCIANDEEAFPIAKGYAARSEEPTDWIAAPEAPARNNYSASVVRYQSLSPAGPARVAQ